MADAALLHTFFFKKRENDNRASRTTQKKKSVVWRAKKQNMVRVRIWRPNVARGAFRLGTAARLARHHQGKVLMV